MPKRKELGKKKVSKIVVTAQKDGRFIDSPEVSGYRYGFWIEATHGVFYISKEMMGDNPPNEVTLTMKFKKERE